MKIYVISQSGKLQSLLNWCLVIFLLFGIEGHDDCLPSLFVILKFGNLIVFEHVTDIFYLVLVVFQFLLIELFYVWGGLL